MKLNKGDLCMNYSVIAISRSPHVNIYEGLCEVIKTCTELPANVLLVCPHIEKEHFMELVSCGVKIHSVNTNGVLAKIPMSLKLLATAMRLRYSHKASLFLGCEGMGNIIAAVASKVTSAPYLHYSLELPPKREQFMSFRQKLEHWSCRQADLLITMDQAHADFICSETGVSPDHIALAPNTPIGPGQHHSSVFLKSYLGLKPDSILILHAGGIGAAQASMQLAEAATSWPSDWHLVFHAHCDMSHEDYYQNLSQMIVNAPNIHLNAQSVPPEKLDELVSNADIGLAWYDRELLGYRADLLGLAAGKIGRYLRNGIPVVVKNLPTISAYIEKYSCGICVDRVEQIGPAIDTILSDNNFYSENALRCYEEVWRPDRHLSAIRKQLQNIIFGSN